MKREIFALNVATIANSASTKNDFPAMIPMATFLQGKRSLNPNKIFKNGKRGYHDE